jgi:hypothetical protein
MWAFIEELYRDYCLTRLNEIRRIELTRWRSGRGDLPLPISSS